MSTCGKDWKDDRAIDKLKAWILRKLGCDVIGVELTDEQLMDAVVDAQEYWQQWVGRVRSVELTLTSSREYPSESIGPDVDSVIDVFFDSYDDGLRDVFGWADVEINPFQETFEGRYGYSGIVQYQMYRKDAQKIVSSDRDWRWDRSRGMLIISPRDNNMRKITVVYLSKCFDYSSLASYEWAQFRRYSLAQAMKTLAVIRMKFPEKPSATGTFSMDGETMWANAEAMEMQVEEKMRQLQRPVGIITG